MLPNHVRTVQTVKHVGAVVETFFGYTLIAWHLCEK